MNITNRILELSAEQIANRRFIKWVICQLDVENKNGCIFTEENVNNNIDSAQNMLLYATFVDEDKSIFTDHGEEATTDGGYIFPDTSIVGAATKAYIENMTVDGEEGKYCIGEGFLQNDKIPNFIAKLKEDLDNGLSIKTSVEIHAKADAESIVYEAGKWTPTDRKPVSFDFNGSCFVLTPSDSKAILLELNSNKKDVTEDLKTKNKIIKGNTFEMNALNYYDICAIITKAFNKLMCPTCSDWCYDYYIDKFYPTESYVIMNGWDKPGEYWKVEYTITNGTIQLSDAISVEEDWKPVGESKQVEVDLSSLKEDFNNKEKQENNAEGGTSEMKEDVKEVKVETNELVEKIAVSDAKINELNAAIVEANKNLEAKATELNSLNEEINKLRAFKEEKDAEAKKAEINSYFETEVSKNGFTEVELNSLKADYVEKVDLEGLKKAEAELCVKKVKELNSIRKSVEVNSDNSDLFMAINNTEKSEDDVSDLF